MPVIQQAMEATGMICAPPVYRPALLTDNGSGYIGKVMHKYLKALELRHLRTRSHHPQTTGKLARLWRDRAGAAHGEGGGGVGDPPEPG